MTKEKETKHKHKKEKEQQKKARQLGYKLKCSIPLENRPRQSSSTNEPVQRLVSNRYSVSQY